VSQSTQEDLNLHDYIGKFRSCCEVSSKYLARVESCYSYIRAGSIPVSKISRFGIANIHFCVTIDGLYETESACSRFKAYIYPNTCQFDAVQQMHIFQLRMEISFSTPNCGKEAQ
jgi:hypothetical protein